MAPRKQQTKLVGESITFGRELRRAMTVLVIAIGLALLLIFTKLPEAIAKVFPKVKGLAPNIRKTAKDFAFGAMLIFVGIATIALLWPVSIPAAVILGLVPLAFGLIRWGDMVSGKKSKLFNGMDQDFPNLNND